MQGHLPSARVYLFSGGVPLGTFLMVTYLSGNVKEFWAGSRERREILVATNVHISLRYIALF